MASLTIEGIPNPVTVEDSFRDLTPDLQAATVDEIKAAYSARQTPAPAAPTPSTEPTGLGWGAVREGARGVVQGLSATARVGGDAVERLVGPGVVSRGLQSAGESMNDAIPADPNYVPSGPAVSDAIRRRDYSGVLRNLPGAVAETAPGLAGTLAAGAVGSAVGGPVGGLAAAGAFGAGQQFGTVAEARARNDGRTTPNDTDLLAAGGTAAVSGALDAVGARGLGGPVAAAVNRGVVARGGQAVANTGREALTETGQTLVEQAGSTVGTARGLEIDPADAAAAGLVGGASRGVMAAPGVALRGPVESVATAGANSAVGDISTREAASIERVNRLLETRAADTARVSGREVTNDELLNSTRTELTGDVEVQLRQARQQGWISPDEYTTVRDVFDTAARHNKELADGPTTRGLRPEDAGQFRSGLARLDELTNAPPRFRNDMNNLFRDVNTLAAASRKKNLSGPFEKFGRGVGRVAAVGLGAAAGGPMGAAAGLAASLGSNPLSSRVGGTIGRMVDTVAGTRSPIVVLARQKAQSVLRKSGAEDPGDSRVMLTEIDRLLTDERLAVRAANGLSTDPDTMAKLVAEQTAKKLAKRSAAPRVPVEAPPAPPPAPTNPVEAAATSRAALAAQASVSPLQAPQAPPATPVPPQGPQAPPGAPQATTDVIAKATARAAPPLSDTAPMFGWQRYIQVAIQGKGRKVSRQDMRDAVDRLDEQGAFLSDELEPMRSNPEFKLSKPQLGVLIDVISQTQGWSFADAPDVTITASALQGPGDNPTIHSPTRYNSATESYRAAVQRASDRAYAAGDHDLVALVEQLGTSTLTDMPEAVRKFRVEAMIAGTTDVGDKARRKAALMPLLKTRAEAPATPTEE